MMQTFTQHLHLPVTKVDDSARMLSRLKVGTLAAWHCTSLAVLYCCLLKSMLLISSRDCRSRQYSALLCQRQQAIPAYTHLPQSFALLCS